MKKILLISLLSLGLYANTHIDNIEKDIRPLITVNVMVETCVQSMNKDRVKGHKTIECAYFIETLKNSKKIKDANSRIGSEIELFKKGVKERKDLKDITSSKRKRMLLEDEIGLRSLERSLDELHKFQLNLKSFMQAKNLIVKKGSQND